jgi:exo-beta-1,3-glucanase (GH17 family)/cellulose synthase/poly-beta-1,6-N-acetylglucosamine synthase-like glycosyltransferase
VETFLSGQMRILLALLLASACAAGLWASFDRPLQSPDWVHGLKGVAYNPSGIYSESQRKRGYPEAAIREDLKQLAAITRRIRTYSVDPGLDRVPAIAAELGLKVALGIWLSDDLALNEKQLATALRVVNAHPAAVERIIVGNETLLRRELTAAQVAGYIARVRKAAPKGIPVGTAEEWSAWLNHPELAAASDFIAIHLLPYWEGVRASGAMAYVEQRHDVIRKTFPGKPVIIAEAGWPSDGRVKKAAVPSAAMEADFIRTFAGLAAARNYDYYAFEAYDQPWKAGKEGAVGAYWGIFDAARAPKFEFAGPLSTFSAWPAYALAAGAGTFVIGLLVLALLPAVRFRGYLLLAAMVGIVVSGALFIVEASALTYIGSATLLGALVIVPAGLFAALLLVTETAEGVLALWRRRRRTAIAGTLAHAPRVSIHVPTHGEPPLMVMQSLAALARLDYPDFEVIVLDNNTRDDDLWKPVESYCRSLGPRFRFHHVEHLQGYKAGALNKALALTDPAAEFIAVVDSDYQVAPQWLATVMPGFADPAVALVQAPQDYRDAAAAPFKTLCNEEYTAFFHIGMVERNEENAVIQHGTMCVLRRTALEEVGGWAEWCVAEDTELGLRLFEAGYSALYTPVTLGRGLIPDTFGAYRGQRYRWVCGSMQILKRHAASVFTGRGSVNGRPARLTPAQRYHFLAGWLPWLADGLWLAFGVFSLVWTALMAVAPKQFDVPLAALSGVALVLFAVKIVRNIALHRAKVGSGFRGAAAGAVTGLALAYTVGRGVLAGLMTSSRPFVRTPKCESSERWTRALKLAAPEALLLAATVLAIAITVMTGKVNDPAELVWIAVLAVLAVPYAAAVALALVSTLEPRRLPVPQPEPESVTPEPAYRPRGLDLAA